MVLDINEDGERPSDGLDLFKQTDSPLSERVERHRTITEIVGNIFSRISLQQKSILNQDQMVHVAIVHAFAETYNVPIAAKIIDDIVELQISGQGGVGRRNLTQVLSALSSSEDMAEKRSLMGKIFGQPTRM